MWRLPESSGYPATKNLPPRDHSGEDSFFNLVNVICRVEAKPLEWSGGAPYQNSSRRAN